MGGDGLDDIYSGDGNNFVTGGRLEDSDGNTDLEILQEHMTAHNDIFEDDDWILGWLACGNKAQLFTENKTQ